MRFVTIGLLSALVLGLFGCGSSRDKEIQRVLDSPISYHSHLSPWADMGDYMTWSWVPIPDNLPIDPRANDPALRAEVEGQVGKHMKARGYLRTHSIPDLYISYHVTKRDITPDEVKEMYNGRYLPDYRMDFSGSGKAVSQWKEGSVLVFLFDSKSERMVWQSSATAEITDEAPADKSKARLDEAMKLMFASLPGKPTWQTQ